MIAVFPCRAPLVKVNLLDAYENRIYSIIIYLSRVRPGFMISQYKDYYLAGETNESGGASFRSASQQ